MASYQYVYVMKNVTKMWPGGTTVLNNITLSFLPGVKIGVLGPNGSGKSTLLKLMAGIEKDYNGEAWADDGVRIGYLAQEPQLDPTKTVMENVVEALKPIKDMVDQVIVLKDGQIKKNYNNETKVPAAELEDL